MKTYCKGLRIGRPEVERAYEAWLEAPSGRKNSWRVVREHGSAAALIDELVSEIQGRRLAFAPIRRYVRKEPTNGKERFIGVLSVKQQVTDYIIVTCAMPLLSAKVGYYQVSGIKGKGGRFATESVRRWVSDGSCAWFAKSDIRKCYPSTRPADVLELYRRYLGSDDLVYCIEAAFSTYATGGMEIGSFLSQRSMAFALSFAYHHVEGLFRERRGKRLPMVVHQIWQADDMVLFSRSKRDVKAAMRSLEAFLADGLGLTLKGWKPCRVGEDEPVDICGSVSRPSHVEIRDRTFLRGRRAFRSFARAPTLASARRVCSYYGIFKNADCADLMRREHMHSLAARARRMVSENDRRKEE